MKICRHGTFALQKILFVEIGINLTLHVLIDY